MNAFAFPLLMLLCHGAPEQALALAHFWHERGEHAAAASVYDRLALRGAANGPFHVNQGNAHFAAGNLAEAILAYRRAERYLPHDRQLKENLAAARTKVAAATPGERGRPWWAGWLGRHRQVRVALLLHVLGWTLLLVGLWRPAARWRVFGVLLLLSAGTLTAAAWWEERDAVGRPLAVVRDETVLFSGNGYSYPPRLDRELPWVLHGGVEVRIIGVKKNGWLHVELTNGVTGWLPREAVLLDREPG
jgi:hypothetical protein